MRGAKDLGTMPLQTSGACAAEHAASLIAAARLEMAREWSPREIPLREELCARPHVYAVGVDEIRITVPFVLPRRAPVSGLTDGQGSRDVDRRETLAGSEARREDNVGRALRTIYDIIKCNKWQYFCTQTINPEWLGRDDLHGLIGRMSRGVADQNKRVHHRGGEPLRYLWVPELHKDEQCWHIHGVMSGLSDKDLRRNENGYLEWAWSADRVGFFSLSAIQNRERCASYVRKYATKNIAAGGMESGTHLYYCSKGLARPVHMAPSSTLESRDLAAWVKARVKDKPALARRGEWADTYTLQGADADAFRARWGDLLEVVG